MWYREKIRHRIASYKGWKKRKYRLTKKYRVSHIKISPKNISLKIDGKKVKFRIKKKFVPEGIGDWQGNEVHVEPKLPKRTERAILVHEAVENFLMTKKKYSYEQAHRKAVIAEHESLVKKK